MGGNRIADRVPTAARWRNSVAAAAIALLPGIVFGVDSWWLLGDLANLRVLIPLGVYTGTAYVVAQNDTVRGQLGRGLESLSIGVFLLPLSAVVFTLFHLPQQANYRGIPYGETLFLLSILATVVCVPLATGLFVLGRYVRPSEQAAGDVPDGEG